MCYNI